MNRVVLFIALFVISACAELQYVITPLFKNNSNNTVALGEGFVASIRFTNVPDTTALEKYQYKFNHKPNNMIATTNSPGSVNWTINQGHYAEVLWTPMAAQVGTSDSFELQICDSAGANCGVTYKSPKINVVAGGVGILFYDQAASYTKQIDIGTQIANFSTTTLDLSGYWYDYYVQASPYSNRIEVEKWTGDSKMCLQVFSCDSGRYIIRHQIGSGVTVSSNGIYPSPSSPNKVGYFEHGSTVSFLQLPEKINPGNSQDPSYPYFSDPYQQAAYARAIHYTNSIVLHNSRGDVINGGQLPIGSGYSSCVEVNISAFTGACSSSIPTNNQAPTLAITRSADTIYGGEDYAAFLNFSDPDGNAVAISLENAPSWLEVGTVKDFLPNNSTFNWQHTDTSFLKPYVRSKYDSIRGVTHIAPGTYSYTVVATDIYGAKTRLTKSFVVKAAREHPSAPSNGVGVLFMDEMWSANQQIDLSFGLGAISANPITLSKPYLDFFLDSATAHGNSFTLWYDGVGGHDSAWNVVDCGNGKWRFRDTLPWTLVINPATTSRILPKFGYMAYTGIPILNKPADYSYPDSFSARRFKYNDKVLLHNGDGTLLWGSAPSWASQCPSPGGLVILDTNVCQLTLQASSGGTVTPSGAVVLPSSGAQTISASPGAGKIFDHWSVISGTASFVNSSASATTVIASCGAIIKALFVSVPSGGQAIPDGTDTCYSKIGTKSSADLVLVSNKSDSVWVLLASKDTNQFVSDRILYLDDSAGGVGRGSWNRRIRFSGIRQSTGMPVWNITEEKYNGAQGKWIFKQQVNSFANNATLDTVPVIGTVGINWLAELRLNRSSSDSLRWWFDTRGFDIGSDSVPVLALRGASSNVLVLDGHSCDWFGTCASSVAPLSSSSTPAKSSSSSIVPSSCSVAISSSSSSRASSSSVSSSSVTNACTNAIAISDTIVLVPVSGACYKYRSSPGGKGKLFTAKSTTAWQTGAHSVNVKFFGVTEQNSLDCSARNYTLSVTGDGSNSVNLTNYGAGLSADGNVYLYIKSLTSSSEPFSIAWSNWNGGTGCKNGPIPGP